MNTENIKAKYEARILAILNRIKSELESAGFECEEPYDLSSDDYRWSLLVKREAHEGINNDDVDVTFTIAESDQYDGTQDGINFMLDIVQVGGLIMGGLSPYNYTDKVWVHLNDADAIEERFAILEDADLSSIADLLEASHLSNSVSDAVTQ